MENDHKNSPQKLIVAVSGGPDSMALLHLMKEWTDEKKLVAVTIDHGFREGSLLYNPLILQKVQKKLKQFINGFLQ